MEIDIEKIRKIAEEKYPFVQTDKIGNNYYISYNMEQDCRREGFIEAIKWLMSQGETIETIIQIIKK